MKFDPPQFEMSESGKEFQRALAEQFARFYETIDRLTAERDEARRELERLYNEKFRGNGALDLLADLDMECGL